MHNRNIAKEVVGEQQIVIQSCRFKNLVKTFFFFRLFTTSILLDLIYEPKDRKLTAWPFVLTPSHLTVENIASIKQIKTFAFRSNWRPRRRFSVHNHSYQIFIVVLTNFQYLSIFLSPGSHFVHSFIVTASGVQTI